MMTRLISIKLIILLTGFSGQSVADRDSEAAWAALKRGEAVALLRHSRAPHNEDHPSFFEPEECKGERNLSPEGQAQSIRMGEIFKAQGITQANVYSSYWCRCVDTGKFLDLGEVTQMELIYSTFDEPEKKQVRKEGLTEWIKQNINNKDSINILSTHAFNIRDLLNLYAEEGEVLIIGMNNEKLNVLYQFVSPTR